jgi:uncharacterized coiled-coil DUF342 family protein
MKPETEIELLRKERDEARQEIERIREERDAARRLVCRYTKKTYRTLREMAEERGWDCYAKETKQ